MEKQKTLFFLFIWSTTISIITNSRVSLMEYDGPKIENRDVGEEKKEKILSRMKSDQVSSNHAANKDLKNFINRGVFVGLGLAFLKGIIKIAIDPKIKTAPSYKYPKKQVIDSLSKEKNINGRIVK